MRQIAFGAGVAVSLWFAGCTALIDVEADFEAATGAGGTSADAGGESSAGESGAANGGGAADTSAAGAPDSEGCTQGDLRCSGLTPEECSEDGTWLVTRAACAVACLDGNCVECAEDAPDRCRDGAVQACGAGSWTFVEVCDVTCEAGTCVEGCSDEGTLQCNGDTAVQRCEGGVYVDGEACEAGCVDGACLDGECLPNATRCNPDAESEAQSCGADATWGDGVPCPDGTFCVGGSCKLCIPGDKRCSETGPQECNENGDWVSLGACSDPDPACLEGDCVPCTPEGKRCAGNELEECTSDGQGWTNVETCSGDTPACLESTESCGRCSEGDRQCDEDVLQECGETGAWITLTVCSEEDLECVAGACVACDPDAGQRRCQDDNAAQTCDADGSWSEATECTGDTPVCRQDLNANCGCKEGARRCLGNTPQSCGGGSWLAEDPCSGGLGYCLPSSGRCVACEPGDESCQNGVAASCDDSGNWESLNSCSGSLVNCGGCDIGESCSSGADCGSGVCLDERCAECEPELTDCVGVTPRVCSDSGTWVNQGPCDGDAPVCTLQGCVCDDGSESCSDGIASVCDDGQWMSLGGCAGQTINCGGCQLGEPCDEGGDCESGSCPSGECEPALFSQQRKLNANDDAAEDRFGSTVALSGDTALVGAQFNDEAGSDAGAAYAFVRNGSTWTQQQKLVGNDTGENDNFGVAVALSGDTALIGASRAAATYVNEKNAAYVFVRSGSTWTQQEKLVASDPDASSAFGEFVALSGDTALVSADESDAAYVFVRSGSTWTDQQKLVADDAGPADDFGFSVALSGDTALVGGRVDGRAAHVFVRNGSTWTEQERLMPIEVVAADDFAQSVALNGDTALVGAYLDDEAGSNAGAAYVFVRSGSSWTQQQKLVANDAAGNDNFGRSVAVSGDTALIGAYREDDAGTDAGAVYVFVRSGSSWTQRQKLVASDPVDGDSFGWSTALSGDVALIGAQLKDDAGNRSGSAYVFVR